MEKISNLISLELVKNNFDKPNETGEAHKTAEVINWLFKELQSNFTAFKQAWPTDSDKRQAKKTWLKAFILAKIDSVEQLQYGLNRCYLMENPFIPTPGQFISWCKPTPQELGLPSNDKAYNEACYNSHSSLISCGTDKYCCEKKLCRTWSHVTVKHAWTLTGSWDLKNKSERETKEYFKKNYEHAIQLFRDGNLREKIEDKTVETKEAIKQKGVLLDECKNIKNSKDALMAMRKKLGV